MGGADSTQGQGAGQNGEADEDEIIEQFFSLLDQHGLPVEGFRYDLYKDGALCIRAADYASGETEKISGGGNLKLVTWFNTDGASRHG
jgi:hypothetical protein